jgi:3-oxoadipate enol-lactonase
MMATLATTLVGEGRPLVFLHGYPLDRSMWEPVTRDLADTCQTITLDLPGFGESQDPRIRAPAASGSWPVDGFDFYSMASLADACAASLAGILCGQPIILCGLSMGGYVAMEFWKRHRSMLAGLIFCDTRAREDTLEGKALRRALAFRAISEGPAAVVAPMVNKLLCPKTLARQPTVADRVQQMMAKVPAATIFAAQQAMANRDDFLSSLSDIHLPTLMVVGQEDAISTVDEMRDMTARTPAAQLSIIPEAGHLPPLENPTAFSQAVRSFLATLPADRRVPPSR